MNIPELLAPAGSFDKLKVAIAYGADALYLSGQHFGLRSASENFTEDELKQALIYAHQKNCRVYVTINAFLRQQDMGPLVDYVKFLESIAVDALIVADAGAVTTIKAHTKIPVHLSTQASCLNAQSALMWKELGVERVVLGREVSLQEAASIKAQSGLELEMFIHGSMCMAYSGHCVISNYTQGRDSNRGGCAHSCRFEYTLKDQENKATSQRAFFMSSKDLNALSLIPLYAQAGIDSLKVEGRNKGPIYAALTTKVYARALKLWRQNPQGFEQEVKPLEEELRRLSHRDYTQASLLTPAGADSIFPARETIDELSADVVAIVREVNDQSILLECRQAFETKEELEFITFEGANVCHAPEKLWRAVDGQEVQRTRPGLLVKIERKQEDLPLAPWNLVRKNKSVSEVR